MTRQNCYSLAGKFWFIHHIQQTLHLQILIYLGLQNSLNGKNFNFLEDCKRYLKQFLAQNDQEFWEDGIIKFPEKWQKIVEQNGEYIVQ